MDDDLRKKLKDYAKYLQDSTYHPYDTIEGFAYKLDRIIEEDDNGIITVCAWDDFRHYNERNYPPAMIFSRNKSDQTTNF